MRKKSQKFKGQSSKMKVDRSRNCRGADFRKVEEEGRVVYLPKGTFLLDRFIVVLCQQKYGIWKHFKEELIIIPYLKAARENMNDSLSRRSIYPGMESEDSEAESEWGQNYESNNKWWTEGRSRKNLSRGDTERSEQDEKTETEVVAEIVHKITETYR